ncbi:MAG TPA: Mur ligase family protein, partial [Deinococcales bacterium]|nr:Mur ligase family protein [Deinococcales bacterium]
MSSDDLSTVLDPAELIFAGASLAPDARPASAITFDSRAVDGRTAFAALPGAQRHGRDYATSALERGAPFVLTDQPGPRAAVVSDPTAVLREWARRRRDQSGALVIGITGSAGKTTAKEYAAAALDAGRTPGNLNTLNAIACYLLGEARRFPRHVVEMGIDRPGEMAELRELVNPSLGVVTAVGPAHLEALGTVENVALEKGGIMLDRPGLVSEDAAPYYPGRDSYGFGPAATHRGEDLRIEHGSTSFRYRGVPVTLQTPSTKVAAAALLGMVLAEREGVDLAAAAGRIAAVQVPGGRMLVQSGRITLLDDTYNANPLSVAAALEALGRYPGRRVAVLGDMRELGPDAA